jgi:hypothetical protein
MSCSCDLAYDDDVANNSTSADMNALRSVITISISGRSADERAHTLCGMSSVDVTVEGGGVILRSTRLPALALPQPAAAVNS